MSAVKNIFKAIDFLFDTPQNKRRDIKDPEGTVVIEKDILYDEKYPKDCLMDFYHVPRSNGEKYPVVLYIHGGGWEAGDKKFRSGISKWYALNGWYVVNINYVLCPEYKYPVPVQNVVTAYNWIVDNAERLNLSLDNFIVTGDSAGSYFAAMVGAIDKNPTLQDKLGCATKHPVQALVLNCGVYDLRYAFVSKRLVFNLGELMLKDYVDTGRKSFESNEYADFISPIDYLNENFPPCFITYSKKDLFCGGQGELLEAALTKIGVYYEAYHSKQFKNNHCFSINTRSK
ncbi:MAG: alpha/beta hydrolase [Clostridia bacterium]|nr:alpha/beta hydrolase [Clostridia bacterium]